MELIVFRESAIQLGNSLGASAADRLTGTAAGGVSEGAASTHIGDRHDRRHVAITTGRTGDTGNGAGDLGAIHHRGTGSRRHRHQRRRHAGVGNERIRDGDNGFGIALPHIHNRHAERQRDVDRAARQRAVGPVGLTEDVGAERDRGATAWWDVRRDGLLRIGPAVAGGYKLGGTHCCCRKGAARRHDADEGKKRPSQTHSLKEVALCHWVTPPFAGIFF